MTELAELEQAKLDAQVMFDMWRVTYTRAQLLSMTDGEFEVWKSETKRLWEIVIDSERAFWRAEDQVTV